MQCRYCSTWNETDERRCVRCGRRMHISAPRAAGETYISSATAPDLRALPSGKREVAAPPQNLNYQPSLFRDASNSPKVIPIPTLINGRPEKREELPAPTKKPVVRNRTRSAQNSQASLDFYNNSKGIGTQVEAVIYCDAPVALPTHRLIAAAFDATMIMLAITLFLGIFFVAGGDLALTKVNAPFFLVIGAILAMFYRLLWSIADGDTPGMRFAGLRLVDFDGRKPDRDQRGMRQVAGLLSLFSAGLGLLWALVDEESLTWHDHISKTFPTAG
jgi:uncharacterized RDD family membrane protein YckC